MIGLADKLKNISRPNIINLKECRDRRDYTREEFALLDVHDIKIHEYDRYEEGKSIGFVGDAHACATTTKGVTSSHMLTIKWWYENTDEEYGIFFEDDLDYATVRHWNFTLQEFIEKCNKWDWGALHLCNVFEYPYDVNNEYIPMVPRIRQMWDHGLQAYIMKREYAKKIIDYYFDDFGQGNINYRMPLGSPVTTENNLLHGFGLVITFPLFNHNVQDFRSKNIYYYNEQAKSAFYSYELLKEWWETKGAWLSLDQIFDNGREPTKIYGELNYD